MIKAIVFDCFGVLAEDGWLPFKRNYIGDNKELADQLTDLGKQNEYGYIDAGEYLERASELLGVGIEELMDAVGGSTLNIELFNYIADELKPSYKIGILSNANFDVVSELFTPDQADLFDAIVISYEVKLVKPDHRIFELTANRLGVELDECLLVDDIERYCTAAQSIGMRAVHYYSPEQAISEVSRICTST